MDVAVLNRLRTRLVPAADGSLALTAALLEDDRLTAPWPVLLGVEVLELTGAAVTVGDDGGSVTVTGLGDFMAAAGVPLAVTFFAARAPSGPAEDTLECLVTAEAFPSQWGLGALYPDMPGYTDYRPELLRLGRQPSFLLDSVFRDMRPVYSSFDFGGDLGDGGRQPGSPPTPVATLSTVPVVDGKPLRAGVNFAAVLTLAGEIWAELRALCPNLDRLDAAVLIADTEDGPVVELRHELDLSLALPGAGSLSLALKAVAIRSGLDPYRGDGGGIVLLTELAAGDRRLQLDLWLAIGAGRAVIRGTFEGGPLTLADIEGVLGIDGIASLLPGPLAGLGGFGLASLDADLSVAPPRIDRLRFVLTTAEPWSLVPDYVELTPAFTITVTEGTDGAVREIEGFGLWQLGGTAFETFIAPATGDFGAYMAVGESLDLGALFTRLLPGIEKPDCQIIDLDLYGNYLDGTYGFDLETGGGWPFGIGGVDFSVQNISISAEYDGEGFSGRLAGSLDIAGWRARVAATLDERLSIEVSLPEVDLGELAEAFLTLVRLPADLPAFVLRDLNLRIVPSTGDFDFSGASDSELELFPGFAARVVNFAVSRTTDGEDEAARSAVEARLQLALQIDTFDLTASADYYAVEGGELPATSEWRFEASSGGERIPFGALLASLTDMVGLDYPLPTGGLALTSLDLRFNLGAERRYFALSCAVVDGDRLYGRFSVAAERHLAADGTETPWSHVTSLEAALDIGLSQLPLAGPTLNTVAKMQLKALQLSIASRDFERAEIAWLRGHISPQAPRPADASLAEGADFSVQVTIAGEVPSFRSPVRTQGSARPGVETTASEGGLATVPASAPARPAMVPADDGTKWFPVGRGFGPVSLQRLGLRLDRGVLTVLFDARLGLQGLTFDLTGLGVSSPLDRFDPSFEIAGVGIEYAQGPISVGGALLRTPGGGFAGAVRMGAEKFSLTAIGEYLDVGGRPSVFVFGVLDQPLGGPPYCFIRGVAAGLGFNSRLVLPGAEGVPSFSLVQAAQGASGFGGSSLSDVLRSMGDDIRPQPNAQWLAAGIRFSSFEIVQSVALLAVRLDGTPRIDLIGLSRLSVPPMSDSPIAFAELALRASIDPSAGLLAVEGQLTANSYVLARDCRPTGGFAFYSWFAGPHEGDFVLSVGGYHPDFPVPAHYPRVPRTGISWRLSDNLMIKGTQYFALVPNALMAGGSIEVVWEAGDIRAWFSASYDFLIYWKPFRYAARVAISVGVAVHIDLWLTSFTLEVQIGAELTLHGPPFGGEARISLSVVSFTIPFGESRPSAPPIDWAEFKRSFLPAVGGAAIVWAAGRDAAGAAVIATDTLCTIRIAGGLVRDLGPSGRPGAVRWVVTAEGFAIETASVIPSKAATRNGAVLGPQGTDWSRSFGVAPSAVPEDAFLSTHHVWIEQQNGSDAWEVFDGLVATPVIRNVPAALWGAGGDGQPQLGGQSLVRNTLAGFAFSAPSVTPDRTRPVAVAELLFEDVLQRQAVWSALPPESSASSLTPAASDRLAYAGPNGNLVENRDYRLSGLTDPATAARRGAVIEALRRRGSPVRTEVDLAPSGRTSRTDWPQIRTLGRAAA